MKANQTKKIAGKGMNPKLEASGEKGRYKPRPMIVAVIISIGKEARLWKKGILEVRMTWTISVCVIRLSTNQPV